MLSAGIVGIPDDALCPYAHPNRRAHSRIIAEVAFELGEQVAWTVICDDRCYVTEDKKGRPVVELCATLAAYRTVYGEPEGQAPASAGSGCAATAGGPPPREPVVTAPNPRDPTLIAELVACPYPGCDWRGNLDQHVRTSHVSTIGTDECPRCQGAGRCVADDPDWVFDGYGLVFCPECSGSGKQHSDGHVFTPDDLGDQGHPSYTCAICGKRKAEHSDGVDHG